MSGTPIATREVIAVLLADGWHRVVQGTFTVGTLSFGGGADPDAPGFSFEEADDGNPYRPVALAGPLASVLAVRQVASARQTRELARPDSSRRAHQAPEAAA